jgi:hypothetical protein
MRPNPHRAGEAVELQGPPAQQLREASRGRRGVAAPSEKSDPGVDEALREKQVVLGFGEDLGHPEAVAQDLDAAAQAGQLHLTGKRRERAAQDGPQRRPERVAQQLRG